MIRSRKIRSAAAFLIYLSLPGCGYMTTIMRPYDAKTTSVAIDAKQRVVISGAPQTVEADAGKRLLPVVCAEPSPDALSALSSSFGVTASYKDKAQFANSLSLAEAAGSIGLRTQSIQLMRDAMYRLCEGYMAGAVDALAFETLHRRFQSSMVTILAIEQLTGVAKAQTIVLGGNSSVGDPKVVADMTEQKQQKKIILDQMTAKRTAAQTAYTTKKTELDGLQAQQAALKAKNPAAGSDDDKALKEIEGKIETVSGDEKKLGGELATANTNASDAKDIYDATEAARLAALAGGGSAAASGQAYTDNRSALDPKAVENIAEAVRAMVADTLKLPFQREFCASVLLAQNNPVAGANPNAQTASDYESFARVLKEANEAKNSLDQNKDQNQKAALIKNLEEKEQALKVIRTTLLRPNSTVESCLMYVNSSTMNDFTNVQSNNFLAQAELNKTKIILTRMEGLAAKLKDPKTKPEVRSKIEEEMENLGKTVADPKPSEIDFPVPAIVYPAQPAQ